MVTRSEVLDALRNVKYPGYSRDIVSFGLVKEIQIDGTAAGVLIELNTSNPALGEQIADAARQALRRALPRLSDAHVQVKVPPPNSPAPNPLTPPSKPAGLRSIIAVASGKGGVGKSTCAVNLACGLARRGLRVGLMDCDIYGPSVPLMMGLNERPGITEDERLVPPVAHGVKLMSIGFLIDDDQPVIWRGPMIKKTIDQFVHQVNWQELDFLLVDLPPGTGDAQLSLCQAVPLNGGIVVTTPQDAAVGVARRGMAMFEKVNVPIVGIIENMSYFTAPDGRRLEIFGHGGGRREAERRGLHFLGEIPIFSEIREGGDRGLPVVVAAPDAAPARAFYAIADYLIGEARHSHS